MGKTVAGTNFLAISVYGGDMRTAFEKLASLEKEVRDVHLKGFVFAQAEDDGECEDDACINSELRKDTKRTN